jgi:hypothetical protein
MIGRRIGVLASAATLMLTTAAGPAAAQEVPQLDFTAPNVGQAARDLVTFLDQSVVNPEQASRRADQVMRQVAELLGAAPAGAQLAPAESSWSIAASPVVLAQAGALPGLPPQLASAVEDMQAKISEALALAAGHKDECPGDEPHHNPLAALEGMDPTALLTTLLGGLPTDVDSDGLANVQDRDIDADGILNTEDSDLDGDGMLDLTEVSRNNPIPASFKDEHDCPSEPPAHDDDDKDKDHGKKDADKDQDGKGGNGDGHKDHHDATPVSNTLPQTGGGAGALALLFLGSGAGLTAWLRSRR